MEIAQAVGLLAGTLTTVAFIPQVIKTWKEKNTKNISLGMYSVFCVGIFFWLIYGLMINQLPIIVANGITFILASIILFFKIKYK